MRLCFPPRDEKGGEERAPQRPYEQPEYSVVKPKSAAGPAIREVYREPNWREFYHHRPSPIRHRTILRIMILPNGRSWFTVGVGNPRQFRRDRSATERTDWVALWSLFAGRSVLKMFDAYGAAEKGATTKVRHYRVEAYSGML